MKSEDLSTLTDEQLVHRELDLERTLLAHQLRHNTGRLENTSQLAKTRKSIARAQTEVRRRELGAGLVNGALRSKHLGSFTPSTTGSDAGAGTGFLNQMLDGAAKPE